MIQGDEIVVYSGVSEFEKLAVFDQNTTVLWLYSSWFEP